LSLQSEFAQIAREGGRAALVTVVRAGEDGSAVGSRMLVQADGEAKGSLGNDQLDQAALAHAEELMWAERSELREQDGTGLFVDIVAPAPRLIVVGAVDFAGALCRMARAAGWRPFVVDPRGRFATPERFPDAEEIVVAWPSQAFAHLGGIDRATYITVLTHDPKLDDDALTAALDSEAPYIGAMGSRRAQAVRRERLLAAGVPEEQLDRVAAPIGLDLGGLTSEETALSIMAEMVAVRNGREGGRLSRTSGRIHEVGA
jgi:xanthine dehydrogenase accessory factor